MGNGGLLIRWVTCFGHLVAGIGYQPVRIALPGKAHFYEGLPALDDPEFGDLYQMNRRIGFEPSDYQGANAFGWGLYSAKEVWRRLS